MNLFELDAMLCKLYEDEAGNEELIAFYIKKREELIEKIVQKLDNIL